MKRWLAHVKLDATRRGGSSSEAVMVFDLAFSHSSGSIARLAACAVGIIHPDCEPGTLGYGRATAAIDAQYAQQQAQAARAQAAADDAKCQSYGAKPGDPAYVQCRTQLDTERAQERAAIIGALLQPSPVTGASAVDGRGAAAGGAGENAVQHLT